MPRHFLFRVPGLWLALALAAVACSEEGSPATNDIPDGGACTVLFGLPNDQTGLTAEQCRPSCNCEGRNFTPPAYTEDDIQAILARVLVEPFAIPTQEPYSQVDLVFPAPGQVCGVLPDDSIPGGYRVKSYTDRATAEDAGAVVTHYDACGLCSPLQDLAVYMRNPDLTAPVRQCGISGMVLGEEAAMQCLRDLGFSEPCARIWYFNTQNTQAKCQDLCLSLLDAPYHLPDGTLNACLICDEEQSGPVFKAVAGRTRRNTGLPSSMCRPCSEVRAIFHQY